MIGSFITKTFTGTAVVALAVVATDSFLHSKRFDSGFTSGQEVVFVSQVDESYNRNVASFAQLPLPKIQIVDLKDKNKFDGKWEVVRIVNTKGETVFDKFQDRSDKKTRINVGLELVSTSTIRINKELKQDFRVSKFDGKNTIVAFKFIDNGYEVIEIHKVQESKKSLAVNQAAPTATAQVTGPVKGLVANEAVTDFVLESALDVTRSKDVVKGSGVSGRLSMIDGAIQEFSATIFQGTEKELRVEFSYAEIEDGGVFVTEINGEKVNGIVTNNGQNAYRIRFATGPAAGAMLNFATEETLSAQNEVQVDNEVVEEVQEVDTERENGSEVEVVSAPSNIVKEVGFDFSSERKPASKL